MRVAMFAPMREQCGISDYSLLLTAALDSLPEIEELRVTPAPEPILNSDILGSVLKYGGLQKRFAELGETLNKCDVVHLQHQYFLFGGVSPLKNHFKALASRLSKPVVMTVHEIAACKAEDNFLHRAAISWVNEANFLHPAIGALIVHTQNDVDSLIKIGVPSDRIHRMTHPVPPALPMPDQDVAKKELKLAGKTVITLFGFISKKKGYSNALKAILRLPEEFVLLIAGDRHPEDRTDYVSNLIEEVKRLKLTERVIFTGFLLQSRIPIVMAATDVAIAPYRETSGSGSLANFLTYERPVLASDIPPHKELLSQNPNCLTLFESGNEENLANRIQEVATNSALRSELTSGAKAFAAKHSYLEMARKTVRIYQSLQNLRIALKRGQALADSD